MTTIERVIEMKKEIVRSAIKYGLNLTIYEGNIAFVDQLHGRIVGVWKPQYTLPSNGNNTCAAIRDGTQLTIDDVEETI